jgi:hypothetical protein
MAQASLLHRQQSYSDSEFYGPTFQRLQFGSGHHHQSTASTHQTSNFRQAHTMAQSLPVSVQSLHQFRRLRIAAQQQYKPDNHLQSQQWQVFPQEFRPNVSAHSSHIFQPAIYPQDGLWGGSSIADSGFALDKVEYRSPHIVSGSDGCSYTGNGNLAYPGLASQRFMDQRILQNDNFSSWVPPHRVGLPCGNSLNESDLDTNSAQSPRSYISDTLTSEIQPFTPEPVTDAISENSWTHCSALSFSAIKTSSPKHAAHVFEGATNVAISQRSQIGLGMSVPSTIPGQVSHRFNGVPNSYDDTSHYGSDYSCSQKSSPGTSPWFAGGQLLHMAILPYRPREAQLSSTPLSGLSNGYQAQSNNSTSREPVARNGSRTNIPAQKYLQDRFQTYRVMDAQAQRKADDDILLQGKKNGETYKEIRKKMYTKCAESTLRGRYRSLTKARQDRVRKPVWRERDVS